MILVLSKWNFIKQTNTKQRIKIPKSFIPKSIEIKTAFSWIISPLTYTFLFLTSQIQSHTLSFNVLLFVLYLFTYFASESLPSWWRFRMYSLLLTMLWIWVLPTLNALAIAIAVSPLLCLLMTSTHCFKLNDFLVWLDILIAWISSINCQNCSDLRSWAMFTCESN